MTTYYVETTGNDGNSGLVGFPKLTIKGALDVCSLAGGDTVVVGAGDFVARVDIDYSFESETIVIGAGDTTKIKSSTNSAIFSNGISKNLTFKDVSIERNASTDLYVMLINGAGSVENLKFEECHFEPHASYTGSGAIMSWVGAAKNITFDNCRYTQRDGSVFISSSGNVEGLALGVTADLPNNMTSSFVTVNNNIGHLDCTGLRVSGAATTATRVLSITSTSNNSTADLTGAYVNVADGAGIQLSNDNSTEWASVNIDGKCYLRSDSNPFMIDGRARNVFIKKGHYICNGDKPAISVGKDGESGQEIYNVQIDQVYTRSSTGHSMLIGNAVDGFSVTDSAIMSGDSSLVVKGQHGIIKGNYIGGGTLSALLYKGARNIDTFNNTIFASGAGAHCFNITDNTTPAIATLNTRTYGNNMIASDSAEIFDLANEATIGSTHQIRGNNYEGVWGTILGAAITADSSDRAAGQAAFSGYSIADMLALRPGVSYTENMARIAAIKTAQLGA